MTSTVCSSGRRTSTRANMPGRSRWSAIVEGGLQADAAGGLVEVGIDRRQLSVEVRPG